MDLEAELSLVLLLDPPFRRRYEQLVQPHRNHVELLGNFWDLFDVRFSRKLTRDEESASGTIALLKAFGAPATCYAISVDEELDGRWRPMEETVEEIYRRDRPTILICRPGKLAFYHRSYFEHDHSMIAHRDS